VRASKAKSEERSVRVVENMVVSVKLLDESEERGRGANVERIRRRERAQ